MTFGDWLAISAGNLWRMKLRASLTIAGVVIGIAAFVSMLSFGVGMQRSVAEEFEELGLLFTMHVYPTKEAQEGVPGGAPVLDAGALEALAGIPGVKLAYPFDAFTVTVAVADTELATSAQALPQAAVRTRLFSRLRAGTPFGDGPAREALVTDELLERAGIDEPDSALGIPLVVSVEVASIDSALARAFRQEGSGRGGWLEGVRFDSVASREYRQRVLRSQVETVLTRFLEGYLDARAVVRDTLVIRGVLEKGDGPARTRPLILPTETARRFSAGTLSSDPLELLNQIRSGGLFGSSTAERQRLYPRVILDLAPAASHEAVADSVEALGFRAFSFAEEFRQIQRFFLYFDVALGIIGLIALVVASLGIVNTLVMSIVERRREIGVLKSLGAEERDIRLLFLVESGMIGTIGAVGGILLGWGITRVASVVARVILERQGLPEMDFFELPVWLLVAAYLFGLGVSLAAGSYPSSRAASVDPVEALRND